MKFEGESSAKMATILNQKDLKKKRSITLGQMRANEEKM
jgi:hypothetical protein